MCLHTILGLVGKAHPLLLPDHRQCENPETPAINPSSAPLSQQLQGQHQNFLPGETLFGSLAGTWPHPPDFNPPWALDEEF